MSSKVLSFLYSGGRVTPACVVGVSSGALVVALVAQFGFGLVPCELCVWQRWPYVAAIALGMLALMPGAGHRKRRLLFAGASAAFVAGAAIAGFHVGVEYGWWAGLPGCSGDALSPDTSLADLQAALEGRTKTVPCDEPAAVIAGLSMAGWNFLLSIGLAVFGGVAAGRGR